MPLFLQKEEEKRKSCYFEANQYTFNRFTLFTYMTMNKVFDIANYIIQLANQTSYPDFKFLPDWITHLKLQKILYYAQVVFLIKKGEKAFEEQILAWKYWPVVQEIYDKYTSSWRSFLDVDKERDDSILSQEDKKLLTRVREIFGRYSANQLVEMTHSDDPWQQTQQSQEITVESLINFYNGRILV